MLIIEEKSMVLEYEALVPYELLDKLKITAQEAGVGTDDNLNRLIGQVIKKSRGESVFVIEQQNQYLGLTVEGLGTKNLIAAEMEFDGYSQEQEAYECFSQDTVAMIANDMITMGIQPIALGMYLALGSDQLLMNPAFEFGITEGWADACNQIGAVYGSGDTPIVNEIVQKDSFCLSGAGIGVTLPNQDLIPQRPEDGDFIILLSSSGIHANGLTSMRKLAQDLPQRYKTPITGKSFGNWLLTPTFQYTKFIMELIANEVDVHALINITGHGFRKIMRCEGNYDYVMYNLPTLNDFWEFVLGQGVSLEEAYRTYNMGAGFAVIIPEGEISNFIDVFESQEWEFGWGYGGYVEKTESEKRVLLTDLNIIYTKDELKIR